MVSMSLMSDFVAYAETRDPELRGRLIEENLPLVYQQAGKLAAGLPPEIRLDDLNSWGSEGLIDAVERFDPSLGWKFSSYACIRIRGSMLDGLQTQEWLPKPLVTKIRALGNAQDRLEELGQAKSVENIARLMDTSEEEVLMLMRERVTKKISYLSYTHPTDDSDDDKTPQAWGRIEGDHEPSAELSEILERVAAIVERLDDEERFVVDHVYFAGRSLKELATRLGVAPGNAAALHQRVLARLRGALALFGAAPD